MDTRNPDPATGAAIAERDQLARDVYRICKPAITDCIRRLRPDNVNELDYPCCKDQDDHNFARDVFIDLLAQAFDQFAGSMQGMMMMPMVRAAIQARIDAIDAQERQG